MEEMITRVEKDYKRYKSNFNKIWLDRFTWKGIHGKYPANSITINRFFKDNNIMFDNTIISTDSYVKWVRSLSKDYSKWCSENYDLKLNEGEIRNIECFFVGALWEYFIVVYLNSLGTAGTIAINKKAYNIEHALPLMEKEADYGIDGTCIVTKKSEDSISAVWQAKCWDEYGGFKIDCTIAEKAFAQGIIEDRISKDENNNIIIFWLGSEKGVSQWLKDYKGLYKHLIFIGKKELDNNINNQKKRFWEITLNDEINKIQNI